jgi:hypothetical protein
MQLVRRAFSLARAKTGNRIAAKTAIIAIVTNNSINVNALCFIILVPFVFTKVRVTDLHLILCPIKVLLKPLHRPEHYVIVRSLRFAPFLVRIAKFQGRAPLVPAKEIIEIILRTKPYKLTNHGHRPLTLFQQFPGFAQAARG